MLTLIGTKLTIKMDLYQIQLHCYVMESLHHPPFIPQNRKLKLSPSRLVALILLAVLFSCDAAGSQNPTLKPVLPNSWVKDIHGKMVEDANARADQIKIVFIGDSITARWTRSPGQKIWDEYFSPKGAINLGISADGTQHVLWRLQHGVIDPLHPKMVILLIGTNNLTSEPDAVAYGVWSIVSYLRQKLPDTRVLVQGVFPREDQIALNEKIPILNGYLSKLDDGKMVKYLYFGDQFLLPDGHLNPAIFTRDKVHPDEPLGFQLWQAAIRSTVEEWLALGPIKNVPPPPSPVPEPKDLKPSTPDSRNDWLNRHRRAMSTSQSAREKCTLLFLGDELLASFSPWNKGSELFKKEYGAYGALNFAIEENLPESLLWQIENGALVNIHPKLIVIECSRQLGKANKMPIEDQIAYLDAAVKSRRNKLPDTRVLLLGAFPAGENAEHPDRVMVTKYNSLLKNLSDGKSVHFLDLGPAFLKPDGSLDKDAIPTCHPFPYNGRAYEQWIEAQREAITKALGNTP